MRTERQVEVAVVGGGPAGAAVAIHLAGRGHEVAVFERWPEPRWRACGVYSSPRTRGRLTALGLGDEVVRLLVRPVSAMTVETARGAHCRLDYSADGGACGLDRVRLERALLDRAAASGAVVREAAVVRTIEPNAGAAGGSLLAVSAAGRTELWSARLVIGADGPGSLVARAFRVQRRTRRLRHAGLTLHREDPEALPLAEPMTARMVIGPGWYCGIAPVPGERVNIGVVMGEATLRAALRRGTTPGGIVDGVVQQLPGPRRAWQDAPATDRVAVALPLANRVVRPSGPGFLLVGDAAGFVDPLSGEGLHRALVSADLAAEAASAWLRGIGPDAIDRYARHLRARFRDKDAVSWLLQAFVRWPSLLDYAVSRLGRREGACATFARVMADLEHPRAALDPRFLVTLLRP